jgi:tRNA(Arg) A34 adenosine deaminase TadA
MTDDGDEHPRATGPDPAAVAPDGGAAPEASADAADLAFLRRAFAVAAAARAAGDHPFGALLVDAGGTILVEQGNGFSAEGMDMTAHAERLVATWASKRHRPPALAGTTLYSSAEPCAMCAGAVYWAGIGRVVYGQSERSLKAMTGDHAENPTLDLPCRTVFAAGQRRVSVVGPLLEEEAAALQRAFWEGVASDAAPERAPRRD